MGKHEAVSTRRAGLTAAQQALLEKWKQGGAVTRPTSAVITRRERPMRVPLSFTQKRLWFLDQLVPDSAAYNIPATVRLTGQLNVAALESALNEVTRRHEAVRTVFASDGGEPSQVILPHAKRELPIMDLRNLSAGEQEAEVARLAREEAQHPFDLAHGPLLREKLLRLRDDEHVFLLTMHHIISDGWSMNILVRELAAAYEALSANRAPAQEINSRPGRCLASARRRPGCARPSSPCTARGPRRSTGRPMPSHDAGSRRGRPRS